MFYQRDIIDISLWGYTVMPNTGTVSNSEKDPCNVDKLTPLLDYARLHGVHCDKLRRALQCGAFQSALKKDRRWFIDPAELYPNKQGARTYSRFTYTERLTLEKMLKVNTPVKKIAAALDKTPSAVYREIKRGQCEQLTSELTPVVRYFADVAEERYRERVKLCGTALKIGNDIKYANYLETLVSKQKFSPAAAIAKAAEKGYATHISVNTFYNYVDGGVFRSLTRDCLPCGGKRKRKYGKIKKAKRPPAGASIEKRSDEVKLRQTFGHWEMDTVHGKANTKGTLLVLTERLSRYELIIPMTKCKTSSVVAILDKLKRKYGNAFGNIFKTITVDNGSEFADYLQIQRAVDGYLYSETQLYFCHPYSSFERGSNENANKLIRRWIPKGTPIEHYNSKQIAGIQDWMNSYPRKIFNWSCSKDLFDYHFKQIADNRIPYHIMG
jgi:IS30 family transposase